MTGPGSSPVPAGLPVPADRAARDGGQVVIGVGTEFRHDDGIGREVLARLRRRAAGARLVLCDGDPVSLMEAWAGASLAIVVDAVVARPAAPGRRHRLVAEAAAADPPQPVSSHGLGLAEAIGLSRALGRMPGRLIVHAVEAADVSPGVGLTPAVAAAAGPLADAVLRDLAG
ncbi:MAG: hydrogenase maturation protease [Streptosporangiaceae bacterium]